jgi:hypothetical protein
MQHRASTSWRRLSDGVRSSADSGSGRRGDVERAVYLIDRFRVGYQFGGGWKCGCADFVASDACRHTREAAGRRAAQMRIAEHLAGHPAMTSISAAMSRVAKLEKVSDTA